MNKKIGFIGLGKMASAIIAGLIKAFPSSKEQLYGYELNEETAKNAKENFGLKILASNEQLAKECDIIFLCTKPFVIKDVLAEIQSSVSSEKTIVSIAAGISIDTIQSFLGKEIGVIRIMPNTPALVCEGMSGITSNKNTSKEVFDFVFELFSTIGKAVKVEEKLMDAVTALSGSGPAFYYYLINKFAKSAEKEGLKYEDALIMSAQTALGAAKMILETKLSPEILIKNVTTPGGTTEVGNNILASSDISKIFDEVISKTAQKSKDLGK